MSNIFLTNYIGSAIKASRNEFTDNYDAWRFGPPAATSHSKKFMWPRRILSNLFEKLNLTNKAPIEAIVQSAVINVLPNLSNLEWLYNLLEDDESKRLLVELRLYRAIGAKHVKLSVNNKSYWSKLRLIEKMTIGAESIDLGFMGWKAYKMQLTSLGYPLELFLRPPGVLTQLLLQQYRCQIGDLFIEVKDGDVVIDGGGCYGETALYFACKAGNTGHVFSFEFMPENLSVFHRNMDLNLDLAKRVKLIENPLWEKSGEKLYIEENGPGTRVNQQATDPNAKKIETISIDDLMQQKGLTKLDFIKMDIEGAELQALKGAQKSIIAYRPKLAISIYHKPEDFWVIPQYIASLGLGYRFAIRHFTIHQEETVLFAF